MKQLAVIALSILLCLSAGAQTATSLFRRADSLQVEKIVSGNANFYSGCGHHGPAIENSHCALRIYFNDSGAIDVYSKSGKQMELRKYLWYPTEEQQLYEGAGCDEYLVGKTVGCGGIALWDSDAQCEVKLKAKARVARVGKTPSGSYAEMSAYEIPYMDTHVDILIRIEMDNNSRMARVYAKELNGKKVQFLTGINYHPGEEFAYGKSWIAVWGTHPADVSQNPTPIGAAMRFKPNQLASYVEKTKNMLRIITLPRKEFETTIVVASEKEKEINSFKKLKAYIAN